MLAIWLFFITLINQNKQLKNNCYHLHWFDFAAAFINFAPLKKAAKRYFGTKPNL